MTFDEFVDGRTDEDGKLHLMGREEMPNLLWHMVQEIKSLQFRLEELERKDNPPPKPLP